MVCDIGRNGDPFEGGQTVLRYNVEHRSNGDVYLAVVRHVFAALAHQPGEVGPRFSVIRRQTGARGGEAK